MFKRVDFALHLKCCNRYQGYISYACERNVYFYVVVFSKSMSCLYFHVRSNFGMISFECFIGKDSSCMFYRKRHIAGNKVPKANLE